MIAARKLFQSSFETASTLEDRELGPLHAALMLEASIRPDTDLVDKILHIIRTGQSIEQMNQQLRPLHVRISKNGEEHPKWSATVAPDSTLIINPQSIHDKELEELLRHETIHTKQIDRMGSGEAAKVGKRFEKKVKSGTGTMADYYGNPHELMAQARTAADYMRNRGMGAKDVEQALRTGRIPNEIGWQYSRMPPKVQKRFLKNVYNYFRQDMGEAMDPKDLAISLADPHFNPEKVGKSDYFTGQSYHLNGVTGTLRSNSSGAIHPHLSVQVGYNHSEHRYDKSKADVKAFLTGMLESVLKPGQRFTMTLPVEFRSQNDHPVYHALQDLADEGLLTWDDVSGALYYFTNKAGSRVQEARKSALNQLKDFAMDKPLDPDHVAKQVERQLNDELGEGYTEVKSYTHEANLQDPNDLYVQMEINPGPNFSIVDNARPWTADRLREIRHKGQRRLIKLFRALGFGVKSFTVSMTHEGGTMVSARLGDKSEDREEIKKRKNDEDAQRRRIARRERLLQRLGESSAKDFMMSEEPVPEEEFEDFFNAYVTTALAHSGSSDIIDGLDHAYATLEGFDKSDIEPESLEKLRKIAWEFFSKTWKFYESYNDTEDAGHDFWLTQNHHGAGFWDGDWEIDVEGVGDLGRHLTNVAHESGQVDLDVAVNEEGEPYVYVM